VAPTINFSLKRRCAFCFGKKLKYPPELEAYFLKEIQERLQGVRRSFSDILYIGPPLPSVLSFLDSCGQVKGLLSGGRLDQVSIKDVELFSSEILPITPRSFDLVISVMHLHSVLDLVSTLYQYKMALRANGLMMTVFPGGETFHEVKQACCQVDLSFFKGILPRVVPFVTLGFFAVALQQVGFELPTADVDHKKIVYQTVQDFWQDLKEMGEQNFLQPIGRGLLTKNYRDALEHALKMEQETFSVTIDFFFGHGWTPTKLTY
jgi:hypothetical protein